MFCNHKCTKFGQLILRKIIKIVATRCQILRLKCTKIDFGWGSAPDPAGGSYSALQTPYLDLRRPTSKGREGTGRGEGGEGRDKEKGKGRGREGEAFPMLWFYNLTTDWSECWNSAALPFDILTSCTHTHTNKQNRLQYTAPQLVIIRGVWQICSYRSVTLHVLLQCALAIAAVQCIVIGSVCLYVYVCVFVVLLPR